MALGVVSYSGERGKVYIGDDRDRAATPLFVCDAFERPGGGVFSVDDDAVIEEYYPVPGGKFQDTFAMTQAAEPFEFHLDVEDMPAALLPFNMNMFVDRLLGSVRDGNTSARLTVSNAADWGYDPELLKHHFDGVYNAFLTNRELEHGY